MAEPLDSWEAARDFALSLPGTELSASYGKPAVKVTANRRGFLHTGHEADTSFAVAIDLDTVDLLRETEPATYWQSAHYEGWPVVLVRYGSADPERVRDVIRKSHEQAAAKKPAKKVAKKPARRHKQ